MSFGLSPLLVVVCLSLSPLGHTEELQPLPCPADSSLADGEEACLIQYSKPSRFSRRRSPRGEIEADLEEDDFLEGDEGNDDDEEFAEEEEEAPMSKQVATDEGEGALMMSNEAADINSAMKECQSPGLRSWASKDGVKIVLDNAIKLADAQIPHTMPDQSGHAWKYAWTLKNIYLERKLRGVKVEFHEKHGMWLESEGLEVKLTADYSIYSYASMREVSAGTASFGVSNLTSIGAMIRPAALPDGRLHVSVWSNIRVVFGKIHLSGKGLGPWANYVIKSMVEATQLVLNRIINKFVVRTMREVVNPYLAGQMMSRPVTLPPPLGQFLLEFPICRIKVTHDLVSIDLAAGLVADASANLTYPRAPLVDVRPEPIRRNHLALEVTEYPINKWLWMAHKLGRLHFNGIRVAGKVEEALKDMLRGAGADELALGGHYFVRARTTRAPNVTFDDRRVYLNAPLEVRLFRHGGFFTRNGTRLVAKLHTNLKVYAQVHATRDYPQSGVVRIRFEQFTPVRVAFSSLKIHAWLLDKLLGLWADYQLVPLLNFLKRSPITLDNIDTLPNIDPVLDLVQLRRLRLFPSEGRFFASTDFSFDNNATSL